VPLARTTRDAAQAPHTVVAVAPALVTRAGTGPSSSACARCAKPCGARTARRSSRPGAINSCPSGICPTSILISRSDRTKSPAASLRTVRSRTRLRAAVNSVSSGSSTCAAGLDGTSRCCRAYAARVWRACSICRISVLNRFCFGVNVGPAWPAEICKCCGTWASLRSSGQIFQAPHRLGVHDPWRSRGTPCHKYDKLP